MIYLDNGATSFPKPPSVYEGVEQFMRYCGASSGRAAHKRARQAMENTTLCRIKIAELIGAENPEEIVFTKNATEGLNIIIKGMVKKGDKVVVSPFEHNSVMRPLFSIGAETEYLPISPSGTADIEKLRDKVKGAAMVIINHVSNVSGAINDIYAAGEICEKMGVPFLADCSQSAGHIPIDVKRVKGSVAFPGHKGLFGLQGTGVMYLYNIRPEALCFGGTGSDSESLLQPVSMPDYYESGTLNIVGITGLLKGTEYILGQGISSIEEKERELTRFLRNELMNMKGITLIGKELKNFGSVVSFRADAVQPSEIALLLDERFDIAVRSGLHCAPVAHKTYGTLPEGTVRLSPGMFSTLREMKVAVDAINTIVNHGN